MAIHQSWHDTREQAEAAAGPEAARCGGTYLGHAIVPSGERYRLDLDLEPESWRGKRGHVGRVDDLPCDDGSDNYEVWTDDGHVAGAFPSAASARTWARREGVRVRPGVVHRKSNLSG